MKYITHYLILALILLSPTYAKQKWYFLGQDEKVHEEFTLKPGENKKVTISSDTPIMVSIAAKVPFELHAQYRGKELPIRLIYIPDETRAVSTISGAGTKFPPKEGKIDLRAENHTGLTVPIVIKIPK